MTRGQRALENLDREIHDHIEQETLENIARGMPNEEARQAARRAFGNISLVKEDARAVWIPVWLDQIVQDVRYGLRTMRRSPGFTVAAVLSISLGIAVTAVVFAAIKAVLINPLPYARPAELVQLRSEYPKMQEQSHGDFVIWNDTRELPRRTRTLESLGVYGNAVFDLAGEANAPPEALLGVRMTASLFPVLGVSPMLGRNLLPEEDQPGHRDVVILSHGLWVRRFHSDRSVVGRTVTFNGQGCLVIGVMPPDFTFPMRTEPARTPSPYMEFWAAPLKENPNPDAAFRAIARLRPGVSLEDARQDLASISGALAHDFPTRNRDRILTLNFLSNRNVRSAGKALLVLMAAAVLFMLIGCSNVANLLLARGLKRQREMSIRLAIGAGRWRIARQLLTESCTLALFGGVGGYVLTAAAWKMLPALVPVNIPRLAAARADTAIFGFALALAITNGVLFGIAPTLHIAGSGNNIAWSGIGSRGAASSRHDRMRSLLVVAEVALSVMLVVIGGQVMVSFVRLVTTDPGFQADQVFASVVLPARERYPSREQRGLFYKRILDAVRVIPGVKSAGTVDALPFSGENHGGWVTSSDVPDAERLEAEIDVTGGEYLQTMGIRLIEGRWFREEEMTESNDGAIVNTLVARRLWPGENAIGQRICVDCTPERPQNWKRVIGVVSSARHAALSEPDTGNVYLSANAMQAAAFLVMRTERPLGEMERATRRAVAAIDPNQPVFLSVSMRDLISDSVADRRFITFLLTITACLALAIAAFGVYGVISYTTASRTSEFGIRMAVGARPSDILALVFRQSFTTVAIGLAIGLGLALLGIRAMGGLLAGLGSGNSAFIWVAAGFVSVIAGFACWIPARRAMRVDPAIALGHE